MAQRVSLILLFFYSFLAIADDTVLKLYRAFGEERNPRITKKVQGRCDMQSRIILREDAWRCQAGKTLLDPCFAKMGPNQKSLICPSSPWTSEYVQIDTEVSLNNLQHDRLDMSRTFPWAIELVNGERCQAVEAGEYYDSMPIRYRCSGHNLLLGTIQRCNPVWSMFEKTPGGVNTVNLKKVWF